MRAAPPERLLVIGASGLVGSALVRAARDRGLEAVGAARTARGDATVEVNLLDRAGIVRALAAVRPDAVAICSAWPHVDGCEADPTRSERENVGTVRNLLEALGEGSTTPVLFFSTDHVFDGAKEVYVESDAVRPLSVYAKHKRAVEELLLSRGHALVARTAWVFGAEPRRKNFVYRVLDAAKTGETLRVPEAQGGCPTWAGWLATSALRAFCEGTQGLLHLTGERYFTKAEWARFIATSLELGPLEVREMSWSEAGQVAPRPARVALRSERLSLAHPPLADVLRAEFRGE